jgi:hypothetical protein
MAQLDPADARLIADAANRGKISVDNVPEWIMAMRADPASTRATIAKLAPWRPRVSDAATVAYGSVGIEQTLHRMGVNAPRGSVSAAAAPLPAPGVVTDSIGGTMSTIPAPVRIVRGKDPMTWTDAEKNNSTVRQMFPGLRHLLPPDPGSAGTYLPTLSQPSLPVQQPDGSVAWVPNPNYQNMAD